MKCWALSFLTFIACSEPLDEFLDGGADGAALDASAFDGSPADGSFVNPRDASTDAWRRDSATDSGARFDATTGDSTSHDSGAPDVRSFDAGFQDGGFADSGLDAGTSDASTADASTPDASIQDAGIQDAGDAAARDSGHDAGTDAGPSGGCISGASGTHVVRFTWQGSGSGSTAYVSYDANTLPDSSLWRVTAGSRNIGYRPVFSDIFLGEGGLDMGSSVFIDVQLSTLGLSAVTGLTVSVYGRSFNTTSPGSFTWQSFEGTGASPRGNVSNSAPYEWYGADATGAITAGDDGVRLRLRAGPPSNRLVVRSVELCFQAR
ncbi:MAG: hypothetical protein AB8H86_29550 [Polyangiales bacterium]